jgi:hypothetical protein
MRRLMVEAGAGKGPPRKRDVALLVVFTVV